MPSPIIFEFGEILQLFRTRAKLSKSDVAKYLGCTVSTITNYEKGTTSPSYAKMQKLTKLYGQEFADIMDTVTKNDGDFSAHLRMCSPHYIKLHGFADTIIRIPLPDRSIIDRCRNNPAFKKLPDALFCGFRQCSYEKLINIILAMKK